MFNRRLKKNINEIDVKISKLNEELNSIEGMSEEDLKLIEGRAELLINLRNKLSEVKTRESIAPIVIPGVVGLSAILLVLNYEKREIITTKAFSIATKMFRGL